jgi:hypothetical protein
MNTAVPSISTACEDVTGKGDKNQGSVGTIRRTCIFPPHLNPDLTNSVARTGGSVRRLNLNDSGSHPRTFYFIYR